MSAAELQERPEVEIELVEQWRAQSLARVGYDLESAAVLAASHEVDLHYAMSLLERGCPVDLAFRSCSRAKPPAPALLTPGRRAGRQSFRGLPREASDRAGRMPHCELLA